MTAQKFIGVGLALVGLAGICVALFLFATQPMVAGDPHGTGIKAILSGICGFLCVAVGYSMTNNTFDAKSTEGETSEEEGDETGEKDKK